MLGHIYIEWRLTRGTLARLEELTRRVGEMNEDDPEVEGVIDQIKSLPGFPVNAPPESDFLLVVTDTMH